ncbi:MAG: hypothetical protein HN380_24725, partial [Victivallales bacterium]|nr:hypothetical protein [Victivallales bacterium]
FFNPFLWLANAKIRSLREKAVDEMSLANLDGDARDYSGALVDIAELTLARPRFSLRLVGIVESKNALGDRIRHILSRPFPRSARLGLLGLVAIGALGAALLPMQRDDEPPVPLPESYEDAKGSVNHQVEIGASTFRLRSVARYSREGNAIARAPDGTELAEMPALPTYPEAAKWMDIATIQWDPSPEAYDLVELRVFDHETRRDVLAAECLNFGCSHDGATLTIYSIGRHLPDSLDIWVRVAHKQDGQQVHTLKPVKDRVVGLGNEMGSRVKIVGITPGTILHPGAGNSPPLKLRNHAATSVELDFIRSDGRHYQVCAVGKDGRRVFPRSYGRPGFAPSRQFHTFPIAMEGIDHFELSPLTGLDSLFFDGVALPVRSAPLDPPRVIRFEVGGRPGVHRDRTLPFAPAELSIAEEPRTMDRGDGNGKTTDGSQATGATRTALLLHKPGLRFMAPRAIAYDKDGKPLKARQSLPDSSLLLLETQSSASEIHTVELHLDQGYFPSKPRFVGVANNVDRKLWDKNGKTIGDFAYQTRRNHALVFDFPITEKPIHFLPCDYTVPGSRARPGECHPFWGSTIVDRYDGRQRVIISAVLGPSYIPGWGLGLGDKTGLPDRFGFTLKYYHGPRRGFHFSFRGPLSPGQKAEDSGKPYALTVYESTDIDWQHEKKIHFTLIGPDSLRRDTPLVYYTHSGQRVVIPSTLHFQREARVQRDRTVLDFDVFDVGLADIAVFGSEIPSQVSVSGIKTQFPSEGETARRSGTDRLHGFVYARPGRKCSEQTLARFRSLAMGFAKERSAYQHILGVQAGLKGKWPEFVGMGLAILSGEYPGLVGYTGQNGRTAHHVDVESAKHRTNLSIITSLRHIPVLDASHLDGLALAIRRANDHRTLRPLFHLFWRTDRLAAIAACKELATDDRPWVWLPAMEKWGELEAKAVREGLVGERSNPENYPERIQMRMTLSRYAPPGITPAMVQAADDAIFPDLFTARFLYTEHWRFHELWDRMVTRLGRERATELSMELLQELARPSVQRMFLSDALDRDNSDTLARLLVHVTYHMNAWYGLNLRGLRKDNAGEYNNRWMTLHRSKKAAELQALVREVLQWWRENPNAKPLPLVFKGRVVDPEGKGIAGAEIRVQRLRRTKPTEYRGAETLALTSKPDGSFVLPNPDKTAGYTLRIRADGYEPRDHISAWFRSTGEHEFGRNGDVELTPK